MPRPASSPKTFTPATAALVFRHMALASALILLGTTASALPEAPQSYSVSPELNGLDVGYLAKADRMSIKLYIANREKFAIRCDSRYVSGPETQEANEKVIAAGRADYYKFSYGRRGNHITLFLVCQRNDEQKT